MESNGEVGVSDFLCLMKEFLEGSIDVDTYRNGVFALMKKRARISDNEFRIIQAAFVDADDYEPAVRLEHTILEPVLKRRVAMSIKGLAAVRYEVFPVDTNSKDS
jgi:hypothetical protein